MLSHSDCYFSVTTVVWFLCWTLLLSHITYQHVTKHLFLFALSLVWLLDLNWSQVYCGHEHFPNWLVRMTKSDDWCAVQSSRIALFHPKYPLFGHKCFTEYLCCHRYSSTERSDTTRNRFSKLTPSFSRERNFDHYDVTTYSFLKYSAYRT